MKLPVDGVVAPIAVPLIPVVVVVKLPDENSKLLTPASIVDVFKPVRVSVPDPAVKFKAPPDSVNPFEAVSSPAEVIVPVPVVEIFPLVESVPSSLIVREDTPPDWISSEVLVPALVSLMTNAVAVP